MKLNLFCSFVMLTVLSFSLPYNSAETARPVQRPKGFTLAVLKSEPTFDEKGEHKAKQDYPSVLKRLEMAASEVLFAIRGDDIESYDWKRQSITLTRESTKRLIAVLPSDKELNPTARSIKVMAKELGWGNVIGMSLQYKGFLVLVDGRSVYGGIFLEPTSELAIDFPVIRAELRDEKATLRILPVHATFMTCDPVWSAAAGDLEPVAKEAAGDWKQFPPTLREEFLELTKSKLATEFRNTIAAPRIREVMKSAGKLAGVR